MNRTLRFGAPKLTIQNHHAYLLIGRKPQFAHHNLTDGYGIVYTEMNLNDTEGQVKTCSLIGGVSNGHYSPISTAINEFDRLLTIHMGGRTSSMAEEYIRTALSSICFSQDYIYSYLKESVLQYSLASFFVSSLEQEIFEDFLRWLTKSRYHQDVVGRLIFISKANLSVGTVQFEPYEEYLLRSIFKLSIVPNEIDFRQIGRTLNTYQEYEVQFDYVQHPGLVNYD